MGGKGREREGKGGKGRRGEKKEMLVGWLVDLLVGWLCVVEREGKPTRQRETKRREYMERRGGAHTEPNREEEESTQSEKETGQKAKQKTPKFLQTLEPKKRGDRGVLQRRRSPPRRSAGLRLEGREEGAAVKTGVVVR